MTNREEDVYNLIKENPMISQKEIAKILGIARSSVGVNIANLVKKGWIKGKGYILNEDSYVVVIGASNIDIVGMADDSIILNDSNPGKLKMSLGGVGRNIAENLARLGVETKLLSVVGDDFYGRKIITDSTKAGIDMTDVLKTSSVQTSSYVSIVDDTGEMQVSISDMESSDYISIDYLEKHKQMILNAKSIVLDANLKERVIEYIFNNYNNGNIFVDTVSTSKSLKFKPFISQINTIKPNRIEAEKLIDKPINNNEDMTMAVGEFLNRGIEQVIISNGTKDIYYGDAYGIKSKPIIPGKMVNANGAGDAFMAGLVFSYMEDFPLEKALDIAMNLSKLAIESENTINKCISRERILKSIKGGNYV